ncbi:UNVERIFIED_CONTAM: hypothetical protein RMT77_003450 [Armadillidium vulgare]
MVDRKRRETAKRTERRVVPGHKVAMSQIRVTNSETSQDNFLVATPPTRSRPRHGKRFERTELGTPAGRSPKFLSACSKTLSKTGSIIRSRERTSSDVRREVAITRHVVSGRKCSSFIGLLVTSNAHMGGDPTESCPFYACVKDKRNLWIAETRGFLVERSRKAKRELYESSAWSKRE